MVRSFRLRCIYHMFIMLFNTFCERSQDAQMGFVIITQEKPYLHTIRWPESITYLYTSG